MILHRKKKYGIVIATTTCTSTRGAEEAETDKCPDPLNLIWIIPAEGSGATVLVVFFDGFTLLSFGEVAFFVVRKDERL